MEKAVHQNEPSRRHKFHGKGENITKPVRRIVMLFDILYWAILTVISVGTCWLITGTDGAIFLLLVCALGGLFLIFESKIHPHPNQ